MDKYEQDREILKRLRAGDMSACSDCIELHSNNLYGLALRLLNNEAAAEDVVQETFLNAFKAIRDFDGRSSLGTWLFRIAYNNAMMQLRKHKPNLVEIDQPIYSEGEEIPRQLFDWCCLPEEDFMTAEAQEKIQASIQQLSEPLRVVFMLRDLDGLSTSEVAEILEISESAVKVRLHRARLAMREFFIWVFYRMGKRKPVKRLVLRYANESFEISTAFIRLYRWDPFR
ncbi:MAG: sigma-70 family RNA polymerase sigma factor [Anaerolineae bacterium]|nr:sigma-70 family RNA polymerase sigma factor [Anaerolineae bacterium]